MAQWAASPVPIFDDRPPRVRRAFVGAAAAAVVALGSVATWWALGPRPQATPLTDPAAVETPLVPVVGRAVAFGVTPRVSDLPPETPRARDRSAPVMRPASGPAATPAAAQSDARVTAQSRVPTGTWGGQGIALAVTDTGAHAELDCASGDIAAPLTVDGGGRFAADGVFIQERPGPVREGEEADRKPARYAGRVDGETMTLEVTLTESKQTVGTFTLRRGATPRVTKCH